MILLVVLIMIKVKFFATLYEHTGKREIDLETASNVEDLLNRIEEMFPGSLKILEKGYMILVNGINIESLDKLRTKLKDGDTVSIFPKVGGG